MKMIRPVLDLGKTKKKRVGRRCFLENCQRKVALIIGNCKNCQNKYCLLHRLPETHCCPNLVDKKREDFERIEKKLMDGKCEQDKIIRI